MRNALIAEVGTHSDFYWSPFTPPQNFHVRAVAARTWVHCDHKTIFESDRPPQSNWDKALAIGRHLAKGPGTGGGGIMSDTLSAYQQIMTKKRGYCADYTQVFNGIAIAAEIPVREWGMSFDGFSGYGHAFNEIYDDQLNKWIFIDSFYSFYIEDNKTSIPLSVLELRKELRSGATTNDLAIKPIAPHRFGFPNARRALEYYRQGADQFYLWFGNNVFSYDNHPMVRFLTPISRALEQSTAILIGLHPGIRIIETHTNRELISALYLKRNLFFVCVILLLILAMALIIEIRTYRRMRKKSEPPLSKYSVDSAHQDLVKYLIRG